MRERERERDWRLHIPVNVVFLVEGDEHERGIKVLVVGDMALKIRSRCALQRVDGETDKLRRG